MRETFSSWLTELEHEAVPETWQISRNCAQDFSFDVSQWVEFLQRAIAVRMRRFGSGTYTSYVWYDEQACQLRFATSQCVPGTLPFRSEVILLPSPEPIVKAWLDGNDVIPWGEFSPVEVDDNIEATKSYQVMVWAQQHTSDVGK